MLYHPNVLLSILNYVSLVIFFVETPIQKFFEPNSSPGEYDYIIVGAGSAGCVLANRLSAAGKTVLLLEAGGPEEAAARVPYFTPLLQFTRMDWNYHSQPQTNASYGLPGRVNNMPRGKTLGGTSSMNYMVYSRGNKYDYDSWEEKYGAENWSYSDVAQAFNDIETSHLGNWSESRGKSGEVPVSFPSETTEASTLFLAAGQELGYGNGDYNGFQNVTGFSRVQRNAENGERWSSSRAFINDTATAKQEVILSAGAIGSAQLLMLSGIGPKAHLESLGIKLLEDLPVGENMYDHVLVFGIVGVKSNMPEDTLLQKMKEYAFNRTGPLSYPAGVDSVAFVNTSRSDISNPDLQLFLVTPYPKPFEFPACTESEPDCKKIGHAILYRHFLFSIAPILLRPTSRGFVKLNSSNPFDPPIIDPQILSNKTDFETMVEGVEFVLRVMNTTVMQTGHVILVNSTPACANYTAWTPEHIECTVRSNSHSGWHQCCTAPMGNHSEAVLDSRLRVRNITNLRVVDASSMPYLPSGNIHVPIMMLAHRASQMIIEDYKPRNRTRKAPK